MKALTCEMCGSTEIVRQDGLYVCQACGTKYSKEDAKKMMSEETIKVEGIIKVDVTEELANLKTLARRASQANDWDRAYVYYERILLINPDDCGANYNLQFYKAFFANPQNIFTELVSRLNVFKANISTLNEIFSSHYTTEEYSKKIPELWNPVVTNCNNLWNENAITKECGLTITETVSDAKEIARRNMFAIVSFLSELFCNVDANFGSYTKTWVLSNAKFTINLAIDEPVVERLYKLVRKNEPSFDIKQKKGCYVATAVYGSYDCPEVWTLRRFRDSTLATSWYGRAFIKIYYAASPTLVKWFGNSKIFKKICLVPLDKLIRKLHSNGVESTPYKDKDTD